MTERETPDANAATPAAPADGRHQPARPGRRAVLGTMGVAGLAAAFGAGARGSANAAAPSTTGRDAAAIFDWRHPARTNRTTPTLQVVVNPLIRRGSPIHDNVFRSLRELNADHVRFVPWFPYPRLGVAELEPPADGRTSWDFSLIDPMVEDFEKATRGHSTILNFSTVPEWMWRSAWTVADGALTVSGGDNGVARAGDDWTDYTFAVDVTPLATGTVGDAAYAQAGLLVRMTGPGDGYGVLISNYPYGSPAASGYVVLVPFSGGGVGTVQPKVVPVAIDGGRSYRVAVTVSGATVSVAIDGSTVASFTDDAHPAGTVGFREDGAESARFAHVTVTAADGTVLLADDFADGLVQWNPPGGAPEDPDAVDFDYSQGTQLAVPVQTVADYYRRLVSWYTAGGFVDEYGHTHRSGHHYRLPYWEVLNEMEHGLSPEAYTEIYDAVVTEIRRVSPHTKFVALALAQPGDDTYVRYFLDPTHHRRGVPIDWISYHFYAGIGDADTVETYGPDGFAQADGFFAVVDRIERARLELAPHVRTTVDELGSILSDAATQADPAPIPDAYWNFSGALYAYIAAHLALKGIDVVGESQLVGYPSQYPSVAMLDWNTGLPNARYRVLQLLLDHLREGVGLVPAADGLLPDGVYGLGLADRHARSVLLVNKTDTAIEVPLAGARGGRAQVVDQLSAGGPVRADRLTTDSITLGGYAVAVVTLRH